MSEQMNVCTKSLVNYAWISSLGLQGGNKMAIRYSKTRIVAIVLMTLLGICMFAAIANAGTTGSIVVTVKDANKAASTVPLSAGIAVVDPTGVTLVKGTGYTLTSSSNVYTISGLATKGNYSVSLGDGTTSETITAAVNPTKSAPTNAAMTWAVKDDKKSGTIGGTINDSALTSGNLTTSAAIKVKIFASAGTPTWNSSTTTGAFQVFLPAGDYSLLVYGKDPAQYRNDTYNLTVKAGQMASPFDTMSDEHPWLSTGLGITAPTDQEYGKDVTISFADSLKQMTSISTTVFITTSGAITAADSPISNALYTLTPGSGKTTVKPGKIVIKAAAFNDVGTYTIKLSNGAYDDSKATVTQKIVASTKTKAPALTLTHDAATSSTDFGGITLGVTPAAGHSISYVLSDKTLKAPFIGADSTTLELPQTSTTTTTTFSALTLDSTGKGTIFGLNLVNRNYLGVYELTPKSAIAKFTLITLTKKMINTDTAAPTLTSTNNTVATVGGTTVRLIFAKDIYLVGTNAAFKSSIKVFANSTVTTSAGISAVDVSGTTVTITLNSAFAASNVIKIKAGMLQNAFGVKNVAITTGTSTTSSAITTTFPGAYFAWAPGSTTGTTKVLSVPTGKLKFVTGAAGSTTQPNIGDDPAAYTTELKANTEIDVTSNKHIFIVEVDGSTSPKIVQWTDVTPASGNIK